MTESARTRPSVYTVAVAVVIALVGLLAAYSNGRDERRHASVGDVLDAADPLTDTTSSFVLLPTGRLDIRATGALDDVDHDVDVRTRQAPDDGSFVGVEVVGGPQTGANAIINPLAYVAFYNDTIELTLVADGRRYPIGSGGGSNSRPTPLPVHSYVAVAGTPDQLRLEVVFRGKAQQVDLRSGKRQPGVFGDLYRNRARSVSCSKPTWTTGVTPVGAPGTCAVDELLRTPYYPDLGWAPNGRAWLIVRITTSSAQDFSYRGTSGVAIAYKGGRSVDHHYSLNGYAPSADTTTRTSITGGDRASRVVFAVPAAGASPGRLVVTQSQQIRLRNDNPRGDSLPYLRGATATWTAQL